MHPTPSALSADGDPVYEDTRDDLNRLHAVGKPARIAYRTDGTKQFEVWAVDGDNSRIDGPAIIGYDPDGTVTSESYYVAGKIVVAPDYLPRALLDLSPHELIRAIETSPYAVFLDEGRGASEVRDALCSGIRTVDGMREVFAGSPVEWVRAYEESRVD